MKQTKLEAEKSAFLYANVKKRQTNSNNLYSASKFIITFLLIEHPLGG